MITRRHRWTLGLGGLALTIALAGCTSSDADREVRSGGTGPTTSNASSTVPGSTVPSSTPPSSISPTPPTSAPDEAAPPTTVTVPGPRGPAQKWEGYTVGADGRTLTFTYYAGVEPCSVFDAIVADEGPDSVKVSIYERTGDPAAMCIMIAQLKSATVTLAAPLGGRTVIDGAA